MKQCGTCTLCCKLLAIPVLVKPGGEWCRHCLPGHGCSIYDQRPEVCRTFACQWLRDESFGDEWFPVRARMFAYLDNSIRPRLFRVVADQTAFGRWRQSPYCERLRVISDLGLRRGNFDTVAQCGERFWLILPGSEVEITGKKYVVHETDIGWQVTWP
jgi:Fe-S-cluster containining protein